MFKEKTLIESLECTCNTYKVLIRETFDDLGFCLIDMICKKCNRQYLILYKNISGYVSTNINNNNNNISTFYIWIEI